jgi:putative colanic acid biosynthesis UDP-glucose lipid carrier transferase
MVKRYRHAGFNTRYVTFVGNDAELLNIYHRLNDDASMGYRILGYYADGEMAVPEEESRAKGGKHKALTLNKLGTLQEFLDNLGHPDKLQTGDELYVCLSRQDRDIIRRISQFCDHNVIRFYFVPMSVETLGIDMKREFLDNIEIFTTYDNKLERPSNKLIKRIFDIVFSIIFLIPTALIFPFVWLIIKIQSPGPLLFKQARTGIDGQTFNMLKFRSMHVNDDADKLQATKDDPRKYPFGDFMRKTNIDELPQFINVLRGDMSIVGPRPHMLAHTEQYSELIDKYMVRHFVKPGLTGWAQVTGFRGETKELWQMEGRVKRDIWYMEHWSIWLDIRIIWMTIKTIFIHDKNAY